MVYRSGDPSIGGSGVFRLTRDALAAAMAAGLHAINLIVIEQDTSTERADHFGIPRVLEMTEFAWANEGRTPETAERSARMLTSFCENLSALEYAHTWALVGAKSDPFVLISDGDAFLSTAKRFADQATRSDLESRVFDPESWMGADFPGLRAVASKFGELGDENFTQLRHWRELPSPAALLRLRESRLLSPERCALDVLEEASARFELSGDQ